MKRHGETMKRLCPGLYAGDDIRAERKANRRWTFEMRCNQLGRDLWFEFAPQGLWTNIGTWQTLDAGFWIASRLRAGTHFWDGSAQIARLYNDHVYATLRSER